MRGALKTREQAAFFKSIDWFRGGFTVTPEFESLQTQLQYDHVLRRTYLPFLGPLGRATSTLNMLYLACALPCQVSENGDTRGCLLPWNHYSHLRSGSSGRALSTWSILFGAQQGALGESDSI